jgi:hypothetical protein
MEEEINMMQNQYSQTFKHIDQLGRKETSANEVQISLPEQIRKRCGPLL